MVNESDLNLLCDENISETMDTASPTQQQQQQPESASDTTILDVFADLGDISIEERQRQLNNLFDKQSYYLPVPGYGARLLRLTRLAALRSNAVLWIVMTCANLNLCPSTVFTSVNLLDVFVSRFVEKVWEDWMMELAAVCCITISTKFTETEVPDIDSLQLPINDYDNLTIQRMEFLVLHGLDWHVQAVTAHSYVHLLLHKDATTDFIAKTYDLLLRSILDVRFLDYVPLDVAMAAIKCTEHEGRTVGGASEFLVSITKKYQNEDKVQSCLEKMLVVSKEPMINSDGFSPGAIYKPLAPYVKMSDRVLRFDSFFLHSVEKGRKKRRRGA